MGVTPGLPLNWSWMHKPSVFLAVCQCERGGGSCRSGPGLNDGAHNLCFTLQWLCEVWLVLLTMPCNETRRETVSVFCPTSRHQVGRKTESEQERQTWRELEEIKWTKRMNEGERKMREWTEGMWSELKRREGVWPVSALCWWMRIWGIVCRPICSSVGEVVKSQSQGLGPEGQESEVRMWEQPAGLGGTAGEWKHENIVW